MTTSHFIRNQSAVAAIGPRLGVHASGRPAASQSGLHRDRRADTRVGAAVSAVVRASDGERLGCIRNLSPRGLLLSMPKPPRCGEFVEIYTRSSSLVGQVKWVSENFAGVALCQTTDVGAVVWGQGQKMQGSAARSQLVQKARSRPSVSWIAQDSQIIARRMQFAATVAFGLLVALLAAFTVYDLMTSVFEQVSMGLPG